MADKKKRGGGRGMSSEKTQSGLSSEITASQWRQIVNSATDTAIISTDSEGRITSWNEGARRILGWSEIEMLGETLERIFTAEDRARGQLAREMADAVARGRGGGEEGWRVRHDGSRLWAAGEVTPIVDESERVVGFIKILRDRTAQRQAEESIREERRALAVLNRAGSALAVEPDLHRMVQIVTDAGVELSGAQFGAFFYNVLSDGGDSYMLFTLSGAPLDAFSKFPMPRKTAVFAPTFNGEGIVRSDDITKDPRYGHNAPRAGMPEGHLPVRSYLAIPVISRSGEVIGGLFFGHSEPGVFTQRDERIVTGIALQTAIAIDNARLYEASQREVAARRHAEQELQRINETLEERVAEEVKNRQLIEDALRQAQKMEAIGQLTGGIAHDFNNLLTVIMGNIETMQRRLPTEHEFQRLIAAALRGAFRGAELTQRLLVFARRQPLAPELVSPNKLVTGMSDLLRRALGEAVAIETVLAGGLWNIFADANQLENALINLAVNARDAMPNGGKLTIETANCYLDDAYSSMHADLSPGQYVGLFVTAAGSGIPDGVVEKAFEPFFTTKGIGQGTGLGLSQVYGFVKQSGGHVKIYSEVGQGTCVKLYLPRHHGVGAFLEPSSEPRNPPRARQGETVLVVEDDPDVRTYTVEMVSDLGYQVVSAPDGRAALRVLDAHPELRLLFTDVGLPGGMNGRQLAHEAILRRPGIKVLFTTGYARNAIVHHGRLDPGVEVIFKPFTYSDLATKLRKAFES